MIAYHLKGLQIFREFLEHLPPDDDGELDAVPLQLSPSRPTQQMIRTSPAQAQKRIASTTLVSTSRIEHELRKIMTACCRKVAMFIHILVPERLLSGKIRLTSLIFILLGNSLTTLYTCKLYLSSSHSARSTDAFSTSQSFGIDLVWYGL